MNINCHAFITCDHPGCPVQFQITEAWKTNPSDVTDAAKAIGWKEKKILGCEPIMLCPIHANTPAQAIQHRTEQLFAQPETGN